MGPPSAGPIEPHVFEGLVQEYADRIYGIALRITHSPEDAEDVTQDTFLSAFLKRESFRGESSVSTWLYRIAVNAALQRLRRQRPIESLDDPGYERPHVEDWSTELSRRAELSELRDVLERGIGLLPPDERAVLVLRDVEGFSTAEAAEILEESEAAIKSRLHRARALLRQYLADWLQRR